MTYEERTRQYYLDAQDSFQCFFGLPNGIIKRRFPEGGGFRKRHTPSMRTCLRTVSIFTALTLQ